MPPRRSTPRWRILLNRALFVGVGCALLWFAVEGGEYGTRELLRQRSYHAVLAQDVEQLQHDVDSLQREKTLVKTSDLVLERIAREQYGMLRGNKEILFWTNDSQADSASSAGARDLSGR